MLPEITNKRLDIRVQTAGDVIEERFLNSLGIDKTVFDDKDGISRH